MLTVQFSQRNCCASECFICEVVRWQSFQSLEQPEFVIRTPHADQSLASFKLWKTGAWRKSRLVLMFVWFAVIFTFLKVMQCLCVIWMICARKISKSLVTHCCFFFFRKEFGMFCKIKLKYCSGFYLLDQKKKPFQFEFGVYSTGLKQSLLEMCSVPGEQISNFMVPMSKFSAWVGPVILALFRFIWVGDNDERSLQRTCINSLCNKWFRTNGFLICDTTNPAYRQRLALLLNRQNRRHCSLSWPLTKPEENSAKFEGKKKKKGENTANEKVTWKSAFAPGVSACWDDTTYHKAWRRKTNITWTAMTLAAYLLVSHASIFPLWCAKMSAICDDQVWENGTSRRNFIWFYLER